MINKLVDLNKLNSKSSFSIHDCLELQKVFSKLSENNDFLLEQINSIDVDHWNELISSYEHRNNLDKKPVVLLRYSLLEILLQKKSCLWK